ncbi:hypothetical protein BACI71_70628 [Bacillus mycoides]|uniref:ATPase n=1 Tax=Bacillus mycoides TaxID=1405 RepID=A0A654BTM2_BACMY|nr:hypothetical protein BACI71_70628 [Bacillus mycoides]
MSNNTMVSRVENDRVLVLERVFDAPRDLVFSMFKEPEHLKQWWGPRAGKFPHALSTSVREAFGTTV